MNQPSEWMKFFDTRAGRYRYKLKGSGVIRDTHTNIGQIVTKKAPPQCRSMKSPPPKVARAGKGEVVEKGAMAVEKGAEKNPTTVAEKASHQKMARPSPGAMQKLIQIVANKL